MKKYLIAATALLTLSAPAAMAQSWDGYPGGQQHGAQAQRGYPGGYNVERHGNWDQKQWYGGDYRDGYRQAYRHDRRDYRENRHERRERREHRRDYRH